MQVDNDLLAGRESDRDYTGGFAITLSGDRARNVPLSLDPLVGALDRSLLRSDSRGEHAAYQVGLMTFTPADLAASHVLHDDRPYASLLFVANSRTRLDAEERTALFTSVTIGALGLPLAGQLHNAIHDLVGSPRARGYSHQISAGGELTGRYILARQSLLAMNTSGNLEVKSGLQVSVGYLTEASAALSLRFGRISSAWWTWTPEMTDYTAAPTPMGRESRRAESYLSAGVRVKARAYNAFLQGQFRRSEHRYSSSDLEHCLLETWIGFSRDMTERTQLSYTLNYQSAEVRSGDASRGTVWAAVQINHNF